VSFSNAIPFGDRASNGFLVIRCVAQKGGSHGELVDGGRMYRDVDEARKRAMELCGSEKYEYGGEYRAVRA
jgi:hypothetical protein